MFVGVIEGVVVIVGVGVTVLVGVGDGAGVEVGVGVGPGTQGKTNVQSVQLEYAVVSAEYKTYSGNDELNPDDKNSEQPVYWSVSK